MPLIVTPSCEVEDFLREIVSLKGVNKTYDEVEAAIFKNYLYPKDGKRYVSPTSYLQPCWFKEAVVRVLQDAEVEEVYITETI